MAVVLVHGGTFAGSCWNTVEPLLTGEALAVDLPGRASRPHDHRRVTLRSNAKSVIAQMDEAGFGRADFVGHSLGGATILAIADQFPERVRKIIFLAAPVPPNGATVFSAIGDRAQAFIGSARERGDASLPSPAISGSFGEVGAAYGVGEAVAPFFEKVQVQAAAKAEEVHYIRTSADLALALELQDRAISHLRLFSSVVVHDCTGDHMVMLTDAPLLASLLNDIMGGAGQSA